MCRVPAEQERQAGNSAEVAQQERREMNQRESQSSAAECDGEVRVITEGLFLNGRGPQPTRRLPHRPARGLAPPPWRRWATFLGGFPQGLRSCRRWRLGLNCRHVAKSPAPCLWDSEDLPLYAHRVPARSSVVQRATGRGTGVLSALPGARFCRAWAPGTESADGAHRLETGVAESGGAAVSV